VLGYDMEFIIRKFSMSRGALNWFKMFGAIAGSYSLLSHFFIEK
jgi:hypothetical protein